MKKSINIIALLLFATSAFPTEKLQLPNKPEFLPTTAIYAPKGYDSNDMVEIVVEGNLPNLCYASPSTSVKIEGNKVNIDLKATQYIPKNIHIGCAEMNVTITETIDLGLLEQGKYQLVLNEGQKFLPKEKLIKSKMNVEESQSDGIDDTVYANVESIDKIPGSRRVYLKGNNPSPCFELDYIRSISNESNAYSVLPVLKQVSEICPQILTPFSYEFDVPTDLDVERVLIHVRSMNGKSVNTVFNNFLHL